MAIYRERAALFAHHFFVYPRLFICLSSISWWPSTGNELPSLPLCLLAFLFILHFLFAFLGYPGGHLQVTSCPLCLFAPRFCVYPRRFVCLSRISWWPSTGNELPSLLTTSLFILDFLSAFLVYPGGHLQVTSCPLYLFAPRFFVYPRLFVYLSMISWWPSTGNELPSYPVCSPLLCLSSTFCLPF